MSVLRQSWLLLLSLPLLLLGGGRVAAEDAKIRVACIGDSITYGAGVEKREENNYPTQLGKLLGDRYQVRNFGVSGATLLSKGDKPYIKENAYKQAKEFLPQIVVIKLGTNDTKPQNWKYEAEFNDDCKAMIKELSALESKPKIWLSVPVPAYPTNFGIEDARIKEGVKPKIEQVGKDMGLPVIDLYEALSDKPKLFPDKVHPNAEGARLIAETVHKALKAEKK